MIDIHVSEWLSAIGWRGRGREVNVREMRSEWYIALQKQYDDESVWWGSRLHDNLFVDMDSAHRCMHIQMRMSVNFRDHLHEIVSQKNNFTFALRTCLWAVTWNNIRLFISYAWTTWTTWITWTTWMLIKMLASFYLHSLIHNCYIVTLLHCYIVTLICWYVDMLTHWYIDAWIIL
jgi:hypothetical protein